MRKHKHKHKLTQMQLVLSAMKDIKQGEMMVPGLISEALSEICTVVG